MRRLLNTSTQRIIRILEILTEYDEYLTISELAAKVPASERTIAEDISFIRRHWEDNLHIEVSRKNGILMHNRNSNCIGQVFTELFNESISLQWIKELLFHPNMPIDYYENKLFTSHSTLIRLFPKINRFLELHGMRIQRTRNTYQFLGDSEHSLRDFSASFLLELYGLDLQKYDIEIDLKVVHRMITTTVSHNLKDHELSWALNDDISTTYLMMFYLISLVRENHGYTIPSNYPMKEEIKPEDIAYLQKQFSNITTDNLHSIHHLIFNHFCGWSSEREKDLVTKEADLFIQRLLSAHPNPPQKEVQNMMQFALKSLYLMKKYRPTKTSMLFDRIYYFSLSIKRSNVTLYQLVEDNLKLFTEQVPLDLSSNIADVLFWLCLVYPELSQYTPTHKALLITDFGMPHSKFLVKTISDFFNTASVCMLQIDIASPPYSFTTLNIQDYDVIITTIPNLPVSHNKVLLINDYPIHTDFMKIYTALSI